MTVTPRLEEEYRYDQFFQSQPHGTTIDNFGGGKGLELIPWENIEVILGVPGWIAHNGEEDSRNEKEDRAERRAGADGDLLLKYRLLSANEENGNHILTLFLGFSAPTGDAANSRAVILSSRQPLRPAKAGATSTSRAHRGVALSRPCGEDRLGVPVRRGIPLFQYRIFGYFAARICRVNYTWWPNGERAVFLNQVFPHPGPADRTNSIS